MEDLLMLCYFVVMCIRDLWSILCQKVSSPFRILKVNARSARICLSQTQSRSACSPRKTVKKTVTPEHFARLSLLVPTKNSVSYAGAGNLRTAGPKFSLECNPRLLPE